MGGCCSQFEVIFSRDDRHTAGLEHEFVLLPLIGDRGDRGLREHDAGAVAHQTCGERTRESCVGSLHKRNTDRVSLPRAAMPQ